jgi:hypothetical protein
MNRTALVAGIAVFVAVTAWWWWPTDRRRIIAASRELAETVSMPPSEPELARVTRAARLSRLLAADFRLVDSSGRAVVDGRDTAIGFATKLRPPRGLQVSVGELDLEIDAGGRTARAGTMITMREPAASGSADSTDSRAVVLEWTKGEAWTLSVLTVEGEQ